MTKRKAIEAAEQAGWEEYEKEIPGGETQLDAMDRLVAEVAERAYEQGRIAGLREAASAADEPSDAKKYRQWASSLAKKARKQ